MTEYREIATWTGASAAAATGWLTDSSEKAHHSYVSAQSGLVLLSRAEQIRATSTPVTDAMLVDVAEITGTSLPPRRVAPRCFVESQQEVTLEEASRYESTRGA